MLQLAGSDCAMAGLESMRAASTVVRSEAVCEEGMEVIVSIVYLAEMTV